MARKNLTGEQANDFRYAQKMLKGFRDAIANGDAGEAEDFYNELCGVMCAMQERAFPTNDDQLVTAVNDAMFGA